MRPYLYMATGICVATQASAFRGAASLGGSFLRPAARDANHRLRSGAPTGRGVRRSLGGSASGQDRLSDGYRRDKRGGVDGVDEVDEHTRRSDSSSKSPSSRWRSTDERHKPRSNYGGRGGPKRRPSAKSPFAPFTLDIPRRRVRYVDSPERLEAAGMLLEKSVLLALDAETQPSFVKAEWHPTSLLQIATRDAAGVEDVLIIDLLSLQDKLRLSDQLCAMLSGPFASPSVLKLGVGVWEDLSDIAFAYDNPPFLNQVPGVLNLNVLHQMLEEDPLEPSGAGLKKLTERYLGKQLSKREQRSSWARRPLSYAQINYAACDVIVALRLYDALVKAVGPLDLFEVSSTWIPKDFSVDGIEDTADPFQEKKALRRQAKIQARTDAVSREHIRGPSGSHGNKGHRWQKN